MIHVVFKIEYDYINGERTNTMQKDNDNDKISDQLIQHELISNKMLAIQLGLLPKYVTEYEFTVCNGRAICVEYWPKCKRNPSERVFRNIPTQYLSRFLFPCSAAMFTDNKSGEDESSKS